MARTGWENTLDDEMLMRRSSGGGFWSSVLRWLVGLFIVAAFTAGAAYYWPLHRAHKALTEQYGALTKRADTLEADVKKLKTELATAESDRDRLEAAHGQQEARQQAARDRDTKLREVLAGKLAALAKNHLSVVARSDGVAVIAPSALIRMQGAEISDSGRGVLCSVVKAMSAVGPLTYRIGVFVAHAAASSPGPREEAANRAASTARALEEKCAVPATRILGAGFVQPADTGAGDQLELDVTLLDH